MADLSKQVDQGLGPKRKQPQVVTKPEYLCACPKPQYMEKDALAPWAFCEEWKTILAQPMCHHLYFSWLLCSMVWMNENLQKHTEEGLFHKCHFTAILLKFALSFFFNSNWSRGNCAWMRLGSFEHKNRTRTSNRLDTYCTLLLDFFSFFFHVWVLSFVF